MSRRISLKKDQQWKRNIIENEKQKNLQSQLTLVLLTWCKEKMFYYLFIYELKLDWQD